MGRHRTRPPGEAFISHAAEDRGFVRRLARLLADHGVRYWFSEAHILGAQQWHDQIGLALARCEWFLLVLSPAAVKSKWVKRELLYALQDDRYLERIVPILWRPCDAEELSWTLASFQWVDFTRDFRRASCDLLRIWGFRDGAGGAAGHT
ncbi:MAG: toll/interleukin-1 receptor domain-containing protein [Planctomycetota bacterium]